MKFLDSLELKDIALFCKRWKIREFAVFGSILRDDFKPESDVDILVTFSQNAEWGLFDHVQIRNELESMLNRKVEFVPRHGESQDQLCGSAWIPIHSVSEHGQIGPIQHFD